MLTVDNLFGKPALLLVGGGSSTETTNSVNLIEGNANRLFIITIPGKTGPIRKFLLPVPMYKPYLQKLDGQIILMNGGVVRLSHLNVTIKK